MIWTLELAFFGKRTDSEGLFKLRPLQGCSQMGMVAHTCNPRTQEAETGGYGI
jgi:hypothetical protein